MVLPINEFIGNSPGEDDVWAFLKLNLPDDYISLHNYYLENEQVDVMLFVPNKGVLIIEIKSYLAKYITSVPDSTHIRFSNKPPEFSSFNQAIRYRDHMIKLFNKAENGVQAAFVTVASCYPYISKEEYKEKSLNKISAERLTILKEDFSSREAFLDKVDDIFDLVLQSANMANGYAGFEGEMFKNAVNIIAPDFENMQSEFQEDDVEDVKFSNMHFSHLIAFKDRAASSDLQKLLHEWISGTKIYAYFCNDIDADEFRAIIIGWLHQNNKKESLQTFNISIGHLDALTQNIDIVDGCDYIIFDEDLRCIDKHCSFNYQQYKIEHAELDNIMVKAGAGTGKTYSMISRINYLVWKHNYSPEELASKVFLITFTNDAADEMREKLSQNYMMHYLLTNNVKYLHYIETVENMQISTIHSLADKIIRKYASKIGLGKNFSITSGKYLKAQKVHEALNRFVENNPMVYFGLPLYQIEKRISDFIDQIENKNVDIINDEDVDFGEEIAIEGRDVFNGLIPVIKEAKQLYREECREENKVALSDLILTLKELSEILEPESDMVDYLFIDEFQDTDDVQIELIAIYQRLFGFKIFAVGDVKQCIYRFRGAEDAAFEILKTKTGKSFIDFALKKNYRTDYLLLQRMNEVFSRWNELGDLDYCGDDVLVSTKYINSSVEYHKIVAASESEMALSLVNQIRELRGENCEDRIAILVRTNYQAMQIKQICADVGIEVSVAGGGALYKIDPTVDLLKLLKALKHNGSALELFNLYTTSYVKESIDKMKIDALDDKEKIDYFYNNLPKSLLNWKEYLERLRLEPVLKVVRDIIEEAKPWAIFAGKMSVDEEEKRRYRDFYINNLDQLFEKIALSSNLSYLTINSIINFLELMVLTRQEEEERSTVGTEQQAKKILCATVHKVKGLQYEHVILPYCSYDVSGKKVRGDVDLIYSENKVGYAVRSNTEDDEIFQNNHYCDFKSDEEKLRREEEIRVLYVAMTRAIKSFSYYCVGNVRTKGTSKNWKQFLEEGEN